MLRRTTTLLIVAAACFAGCALPPRASTDRLQYLAPPSFAAEYTVVSDGRSYADDDGFLVVLEPRGSSDRVEIGGGAAAVAVFADNQPIEDDDSREAIMLRGVTAARVERPDLITMTWREGETPYFVRVTSNDPQTVQIFVNALASHDLAAWRTTVQLP